MRFVFHPLLFIVIILSIWQGYGLYILFAIVAVLIHESGHAISANHYGIRAKKLTLLPFGASINIECGFLPKRYQAVILLSGAFANMVACVLALSFMWVSIGLFNVIGLFIFVNMSIAFMNLLPLYPLDGGKVVALVGGRVARVVLLALSNVVFVALLVLGIVSFNWVVCVFAVSMLFTVNSESQNDFAPKFLRPVSSKQGKIKEVSIHSTMTLLEVFKRTSSSHYTKFIVTDRGNMPIYESDLEKALVIHSVDRRIYDVYGAQTTTYDIEQKIQNVASN